MRLSSSCEIQRYCSSFALRSFFSSSALGHIFSFSRSGVRRPAAHPFRRAQAHHFHSGVQVIRSQAPGGPSLQTRSGASFPFWCQHFTVSSAPGRFVSGASAPLVLQFIRAPASDPPIGNPDPVRSGACWRCGVAPVHQRSGAPAVHATPASLRFVSALTIHAFVSAPKRYQVSFPRSGASLMHPRFGVSLVVSRLAIHP